MILRLLTTDALIRRADQDRPFPLAQRFIEMFLALDDNFCADLLGPVNKIDQIDHAMRYTYGAKLTGSHISDLANSKLAVFFGNNPAETRMSGGGTVRDLVVARQKSGVRIIVIDPRHTDTAAGFADEWIPIRPGTDAALVGGLAHVLISEGLVDEDFLNSHCLGYDQAGMPADIPPGNSYRDYILGDGPDGTPKTPHWAAGITGIPAARIIDLAREIGTSKPAYIAQGWGPQRHAAGEQSARAICMLAILTGNLGVPGGNSGDRERPFGIEFPGIPMGQNPVKLWWTAGRPVFCGPRNFSKYL